MTSACPTPSNSAQAHINLSTKELVEMALARGEGELAANGALVVNTGKRTGRSPKDRFIVKDKITETTVDWNNINQPLEAEQFQALWQKAHDYIQTKDRFISYLRVGAHEQLGIKVKVITELAWQNLFAQVLFIHPVLDAKDDDQQWTILSTPGCPTNPTQDGVNSDAAVILNFTEKKILIMGTYYAGELKKAMFSVLNFLLPDHDILPMHCAANTNAEGGDVVLFFGLSGTGKTTLSADPTRLLIGDDEHGWGKDGVFNFEGGCYAKCIDLSEEREPLIWKAIQYGSVIENVVLDPVTKIPNYADASLTQNTRAAYPREFIQSRVEKNCGGQPHAIIFLSCDLYGVLPPVARLNAEQAAYYFLSGYTTLVGSTEVGQGGGIKPTFSTCFGAPFFPRPPASYAKLLLEHLNYNGTQVYLVNTGWTGGAHGEGGKRFPIPTSRAVVNAIVTGELREATYDVLPGFKLAIPTKVSHVDTNLLDPRKVYGDIKTYQMNADKLISQFIENFKRFDVSDDIRQAGPSQVIE